MPCYLFLAHFKHLPITAVIEGPICSGGLEHGEFFCAHEHLLRREENKEIIPSSTSLAAGMRDDDLSTINLKGLHELRLCPAALEANLSLNSVDAAVQELKVATVDNQNNSTNLWVIVDCTTSQLGRNPSGLLDISIRTGLHVVSILYATTFTTVFIYQFPSVKTPPHGLMC